MITAVKYPQKNTWKELLKRPFINYDLIRKDVEVILRGVKEKGDEAVRKFSQQYDNNILSSFEVSYAEIESAENNIREELKQAIEIAIKNITFFHAAQKHAPVIVETSPGVSCWQKEAAIEKVGLYIPAGTAPLFSTLLMLGIPAVIAGCKEIVVCTPANKAGKVHPAILYAASKIGVNKIFKIGGVQAIASMAYGTQSVPKVYKIFGPGNQYVTCAKLLLNAEGVAIDIPAGPSEVVVLADNTCIPEFVAADLLSQAEHGMDSQVLLVSDSENVISSVIKCVEEQLLLLPRKEIAKQALINSKAILVKNIEEGIELINDYAPEHLIICCVDAEELSEKVVNAGSVFLGNYSPESAGDYASGTNHTLPTNGFAKAYSGVSLDSFLKKITFQKLTFQGLTNLSKAIVPMANAEGLQAHANAVTIRLTK